MSSSVIKENGVGRLSAVMKGSHLVFAFAFKINTYSFPHAGMLA